jgi:hypothetical protein
VVVVMCNGGGTMVVGVVVVGAVVVGVVVGMVGRVAEELMAAAANGGGDGKARVWGSG